MISLLDHNLPLQVITVLLSSFIFICILEGFGYASLRLIKLAMYPFDKKELFNPGLVLRIFIGGLFYTLVFFAVGLVGLITKTSVLIISFGIPILAFIIVQRWQELKTE